jgi:nucleoside-diphosphate-sugar epimerase
MNKPILLTGASGFVGSALAAALVAQGASVRCAVRSPLEIAGAEMVTVPALDEQTLWKHCLEGIDTVIHCAGRAHVMHDLYADPLPEYRHINVEATLNLAHQAVAAGVKRFIFISTVKVNGEQTMKGRPFTEKDAPMPQNPYAVSKYEAEQALLKLATASNLEVVIIRSPLIYGAGVKANFLSLLRLVQLGVPLPLGAIENKRSFVYLENLHSLIMRCIEHPNAANQIFFVSDDQDLSTPELLRSCAAAMGVGAHLISVPESWCMMSASWLGHEDVIHRLCDSLQVDISKAKKLLEWEPPISVQMGLHKTVQHF